MYADDPLVLELTALLKSHRVEDIVISPGSRHYAFTRTFEAVGDFRLHSVVDERSAAFFALGLTQSTGRPAATICTSGTAAINYGSALAEAAAQRLPVIAITTDRLPEFLGQMEDQMIGQPGLFDGITAYSGNLRPVQNERDRWYCNRVINEALLVATERRGPVHLNVPIEGHTSVPFTAERLPDARVITRHRLVHDDPDWSSLAGRLQGRRVIVVWGQGARPPRRVIDALTSFSAAFDAPIFADHLGNVHIDSRIERPTVFLRTPASAARELAPDIVITSGGNIVFKDELKGFLAGADFEHWHIDPEGVVADPFRVLTDVIECSPEVAFDRILTSRSSPPTEGGYRDRMLASSRPVPRPEQTHGELATIGSLIGALPPGCGLHIANSAPIRMAHLYDIDPSIDVFCNRGVNGIDGCLSTAIGYAAATTRTTYVVIGDLTFFYDMNSLGIRDLPPNLRVLLLNNEGGAVMHLPLPEAYSSTAAGLHVSAANTTRAQGWVESLDIDYLAADTAEGARTGVEWLTDSTASGPRVLEVISDKLADVAQLHAFHAALAGPRPRPSLSVRLRRLAGRVLRRLGLR